MTASLRYFDVLDGGSTCRRLFDRLRPHVADLKVMSELDRFGSDYIFEWWQRTDNARLMALALAHCFANRRIGRGVVVNGIDLWIRARLKAHRSPQAVRSVVTTAMELTLDYCFLPHRDHDVQLNEAFQACLVALGQAQARSLDACRAAAASYGSRASALELYIQERSCEDIEVTMAAIGFATDSDRDVDYLGPDGGLAHFIRVVSPGWPTIPFDGPLPVPSPRLRLTQPPETQRRPR